MAATESDLSLSIEDIKKRGYALGILYDSKVLRQDDEVLDNHFKNIRAIFRWFYAIKKNDKQTIAESKSSLDNLLKKVVNRDYPLEFQIKESAEIISQHTVKKSIEELEKILLPKLNQCLNLLLPKFMKDLIKQQKKSESGVDKNFIDILENIRNGKKFDMKKFERCIKNIENSQPNTNVAKSSKKSDSGTKAAGSNNEINITEDQQTVIRHIKVLIKLNEKFEPLLSEQRIILLDNIPISYQPSEIIDLLKQAHNYLPHLYANEHIADKNKLNSLRNILNKEDANPIKNTIAQAIDFIDQGSGSRKNKQENYYKSLRKALGSVVEHIVLIVKTKILTDEDLQNHLNDKSSKSTLKKSLKKFGELLDELSGGKQITVSLDVIDELCTELETFTRNISSQKPDDTVSKKTDERPVSVMTFLRPNSKDKTASSSSTSEQKKETNSSNNSSWSAAKSTKPQTTKFITAKLGGDRNNSAAASSSQQSSQTFIDEKLLKTLALEYVCAHIETFYNEFFCKIKSVHPEVFENSRPLNIIFNEIIEIYDILQKLKNQASQSEGHKNFMMSLSAIAENYNDKVDSFFNAYKRSYEIDLAKFLGNNPLYIPLDDENPEEFLEILELAMDERNNAVHKLDPDRISKRVSQLHLANDLNATETIKEKVGSIAVHALEEIERALKFNKSATTNPEQSTSEDELDATNNNPEENFAGFSFSAR